ncbi:hypothetical protein HTY54_11345 [Escherichia coli]|nr:hypothetical protein [Escherichia coli]
MQEWPPVVLSGAYLQRAGGFLSPATNATGGLSPPQHCASPEPFRLAADSTTVFLFRNPSLLHSVLRIPQNIIRLQPLHFFLRKRPQSFIPAALVRAQIAITAA